MFRRAVVVTQLVERSLLTPEICGSNPVIGKFYLLSILLKDLLKRRKQRKEAVNGPIQKTKQIFRCMSYITVLVFYLHRKLGTVIQLLAILYVLQHLLFQNDKKSSFEIICCSMQIEERWFAKMSCTFKLFCSRRQSAGYSLASASHC